MCVYTRKTTAKPAGRIEGRLGFGLRGLSRVHDTTLRSHQFMHTCLALEDVDHVAINHEVAVFRLHGTRIHTMNGIVLEEVHLAVISCAEWRDRGHGPGGGIGRH